MNYKNYLTSGQARHLLLLGTTGITRMGVENLGLNLSLAPLTLGCRLDLLMLADGFLHL